MMCLLRRQETVRQFNIPKKRHKMKHFSTSSNFNFSLFDSHNKTQYRIKYELFFHLRYDNNAGVIFLLTFNASNFLLCR